MTDKPNGLNPDKAEDDYIFNLWGVVYWDGHTQEWHLEEMPYYTKEEAKDEVASRSKVPGTPALRVVKVTDHIQYWESED